MIPTQEQHSSESSNEYTVLLDINPINTMELMKISHGRVVEDKELLQYFLFILVNNYRSYKTIEEIVSLSINEVLYESNTYEQVAYLTEYYRDVVTRIRNLFGHPVDLVAVIDASLNQIKVVLTHAN